MSKKVKMYYGGTATKHVCGTAPMDIVALHPGVHEYKVAELEKVSKHPAMVKMLKEGTLCTEEDYLAKLGKKPAPKTKTAPAPEPAAPAADAPAAEDAAAEEQDVALEEMLSGNVKDTVELVNAQTDKELLGLLLEAEKEGKKRKGVMDAIEEKLK